MNVRIIHRVPYRGVAQLGSATALGAVGRWFESSHPDQIGVSSNGKTQVFGARNIGSIPITPAILLIKQL